MGTDRTRFVEAWAGCWVTLGAGALLSAPLFPGCGDQGTQGAFARAQIPA